MTFVKYIQLTTRNSLLSIWFEISWIISVVLTQFNASVKTEFFTRVRITKSLLSYNIIYNNFWAIVKFMITKIVNIVKNNMKELCVPHFLTTLKILTVVLNPFRVLPSFGFWHTEIFDFQLSFIEKLFDVKYIELRPLVHKVKFDQFVVWKKNSKLKLGIFGGWGGFVSI